ncbi:hypothetical protein Adt_24054 [Abeliophyllum distichum]|uniref:Uncharacterized protein n=1 Tax=Abeliophyllum distichum TaxID=126358 RepID=A0ABD1SFT9_9LAMI
MEGMAYVWFYCCNINHPFADWELFSTKLCKRFSNCNEEVENTLGEDFEIRFDNIILKDEEDAAKEEEIEAQIFHSTTYHFSHSIHFFTNHTYIFLSYTFVSYQ